MQIDGPGPHYVVGKKYRIVELHRRSGARYTVGFDRLLGQLVEVTREYWGSSGWMVHLKFLEPNEHVKKYYGSGTVGWYTPHLEPVSDVAEEEMAAWCAYDQEED